MEKHDLGFYELAEGTTAVFFEKINDRDRSSYEPKCDCLLTSLIIEVL